MKRPRDYSGVKEGFVNEKIQKKIPNPFSYNINPYAVNILGPKGTTLLYDSIRNDINKNGGYYEKVQYLVEVIGADINKGKGDKPPLYKAIFEGTIHTDFVKIAIFLIEKGARNDYVSDMTPLHLAAMCCSVPALEAFAKNGYDFTLKAGQARDVTVIGLILSSKASEKDLQGALAAIPVKQLATIWNETNIDSLNLDTGEIKIINHFIELNKLSPHSETMPLAQNHSVLLEINEKLDEESRGNIALTQAESVSDRLGEDIQINGDLLELF